MILGVILICIVAVTPIAYRHHKRIRIVRRKSSAIRTTKK